SRMGFGDCNYSLEFLHFDIQSTGQKFKGIIAIPDPHHEWGSGIAIIPLNFFTLTFRALGRNSRE
ncbi:hypothetical protein P7D06_29720, partial [Bacillus mobilis]|uniref:hypothetical protein n=1 Tax=Bacillus mobilis TaxID=2026190 RepID=UPI00240E1EE0